MRTFLRDFLERIDRVVAFANTDNLNEALFLMGMHHLAEVEQFQFQAARRQACKLMQRPQKGYRYGDLKRRNGFRITVANMLPPGRNLSGGWR